MDLAPLSGMDTCQLLCAWCGYVLRPCRNPRRTSHGICKPCMTIVLNACSPTASETPGRVRTPAPHHDAAVHARHLATDGGEPDAGR